MKKLAFETLAIRTQTAQTTQKEHATPLFLTSSFTFDSAEEGAALFAKEIEGNLYSRFSNPNVDEFCTKISLLEGAESTVATASGMGAIFVCLSALLKSGDHVIASKALFGNSLYILREILPKWGIQTTFVHLNDLEGWERSFQANTKLVLVETPSNPTLDIIDLAWLSELSHKKGAKLVVDNCFATPYLQQPIKWGADIVIHSATKWIDGQGRVLGGTISGNTQDISACYDFLRRTGVSLSPFNAWVLSKSLETLHVRMDRHCENALKVAQYLEGNPNIERVIYPHLESYSNYELAKKQLQKGGGIVTAIIRGNQKKDGAKFLNQLGLFSLTANLGDTRSIATHPASTTASKLSEEQKHELGISGGLIRLSIGLENIEDIIQDLDQALNKL
ncbi:trans-sulfuration enzyme family protein [Parvicella tangerina]|uniref:O-succinylhomoserine sulfhydrylase n=1 Tax=Parvicella tangerina TaxID=2829795 RepID=A0A916N8M3_9FLAO|nr:aminotransferase class I/II-fold pyridoxal phosphate-dependent enzyme [Parvicella tangerina]CAG5077331.1 O-succinylhomoserine sulfhydrylase [Parvicella tangerina]